MSAHAKLAIVPLLALASVLAFGTPVDSARQVSRSPAAELSRRVERTRESTVAAIIVDAPARALVLTELATPGTRPHARFEWQFALAALAGLYLLFFAILKSLFIRRRAARSPLAF